MGGASCFAPSAAWARSKTLPASTQEIYQDGYYGEGGDSKGYADYAFTAELTQLWPRLMLEMLLPEGGAYSMSAARMDFSSIASDADSHVLESRQVRRRQRAPLLEASPSLSMT